MLATICICGVAFAALRSPNEWAASAILTVTFAVLLFSLLGSLFLQQGRRAFWTGFALFGWVYGLVNLGVGFGALTSQQLLTTQGLNRLHSILHPRPAVLPGMNAYWSVPAAGVALAANPSGGWVADLTAYSPPGVATMSWPITYSPVCPNCGIVSASVFSEPFLRVGQSFTTLLIGLAGGIAAVVVHARACRQDRHIQDATSSPIALNESLRST
jgi:hypothetical protein